MLVEVDDSVFAEGVDGNWKEEREDLSEREEPLDVVEAGVDNKLFPIPKLNPELDNDDEDVCGISIESPKLAGFAGV